MTYAGAENAGAAAASGAAAAGVRVASASRGPPGRLFLRDTQSGQKDVRFASQDRFCCAAASLLEGCGHVGALLDGYQTRSDAFLCGHGLSLACAGAHAPNIP